MEERYKSMIVVDLMLTRINEKTGKKEVLLALRKNTGYNDCGQEERRKKIEEQKRKRREVRI